MIIISCSLKGFEMADKLISKLKNLKEIKTLLLFIEREMQFSKTALPEILINAVSVCEKDLIKEILLNTARKINTDLNAGNAWQGEIENNQKGLCFSKKETDEVKNIFQGLGISDSETQKKVIKNALEIMEEIIQRSEKQCLTNVKMYRSIGVLFGMFIALLFI